MSQIPETSLTQVQYNDGAVAVKKGSGLIKTRKGQSEEEYQLQLDQFKQVGGPLVQNEEFTTESLATSITNFQELSKIEKERIIHGLERLYYTRNYTDCLTKVGEIISSIPIPEGGLEGKKNKVLKRTITDLSFIQSQCIKSIQESNESKLGELNTSETN